MKKYILITLICFGQLIGKAQVTSFSIDSSRFIRPLTQTLDSIYQEDQGPRLAYDRAVKNKALKPVIDSFRNIMLQKDHDNLIKVSGIIDRYGWLGPQKVGFNASQALFLVLQHADLATQQKYLPMIRKAEQQGEVLSSNLAIMEDRVNVREGKKQLYGSQAVRDPGTGELYFYPIEDPDHLEERRKAMGLVPMAQYVKGMGIVWDIEDYKRRLPEIEQKVKKIGRK